VSEPTEAPESAEPSEPAQADGVVAVTAGTLAWALALLVTFVLRGRLAQSGAGWWVWTCATGLLFGLFGCWWVRRRRARLRLGATNR
jgi:ABC-type nickel/cobalt efflux system permease component RcnA